MRLRNAALATVAFVLGGGVMASRTVYRLDRRAANHAWDILLARSLRAVDTFVPGLLRDLPEPARRYLVRAIAPGTRPLISRAKLRAWLGSTRATLIACTNSVPAMASSASSVNRSLTFSYSNSFWY